MLTVVLFLTVERPMALATEKRARSRMSSNGFHAVAERQLCIMPAKSMPALKLEYCYFVNVQHSTRDPRKHSNVHRSGK